MSILTKLLIISQLFFSTVFAVSQQVKDLVEIVGIPHTSVKDQAMSSTCWAFGTVSFIESEIIREKGEEFDLSEMFIVSKIYPHKAVKHIRMHGFNFFTPGGQPHDVMFVVNNYGLMPEAAYSGKKQSRHNHDHNKLDKTVKYFIDTLLNKHKQCLPNNWILKFDSLVKIYLGKPPETFRYGTEVFTASSFAEQKAGVNTSDYIEITSYLHHPYYSYVVLETPYNWAMKSYYNLPLEYFVMTADSALHNGYSFTWNGDVSSSGFDHLAAIATLPALPIESKSMIGTETFTEVDITFEIRQKAFDNHTSKVDHVMHVVGIALDRDGRKFYIVKNSWGADSNSAGGYVYMSEAYFKMHTVSIMLHKDAVPKGIKLN